MAICRVRLRFLGLLCAADMMAKIRERNPRRYEPDAVPLGVFDDLEAGDVIVLCWFRSAETYARRTVVAGHSIGAEGQTPLCALLPYSD